MENLTLFELGTINYTKLPIDRVIVFITTYAEMKRANPRYDRDVMVEKMKIKTGNWRSEYHNAELVGRKLTYNDDYLSDKSGDRWSFFIDNEEHVLLVMK